MEKNILKGLNVRVSSFLFFVSFLISAAASAECSKMEYVELKEMSSEEQTKYFCKTYIDYQDYNVTCRSGQQSQIDAGMLGPKVLSDLINADCKQFRICVEEVVRVEKLLKAKNVVPTCDCSFSLVKNGTNCQKPIEATYTQPPIPVVDTPKDPPIVSNKDREDAADIRTEPLLGSWTATGGTEIEFQKFNSGDISLKDTCGWSYGVNRNNLRHMHDTNTWLSLAQKIVKLNCSNDQSYYYLGRSAEGLGFTTSARLYYRLAKEARHCEGFINVCDGFVFPRDINVRLGKLAATTEIKATGTESRTVEGSTENTVNMNNTNSGLKATPTITIEQSSEGKNCSKITNGIERLACYDSSKSTGAR